MSPFYNYQNLYIGKKYFLGETPLTAASPWVTLSIRPKGKNPWDEPNITQRLRHEEDSN